MKKSAVLIGAVVGFCLAFAGLQYGVDGFLLTAFLMGLGGAIGWVLERVDLKSLAKAVIGKNDITSD